MLVTALALLAALGSVTASLLPTKGPLPGQIKNLVTFGDSYTDVVSSNHIWDHNMQPT